MKNLVRLLVVTATVMCVCSAIAQQIEVGKLTMARHLTMSASASGRFAEAKTPDSVRDGASVRTAKRGFGEITFDDESVLRINERTEMVVQDVNKLRKMRLQRGALWLRVAKGTGTSIQTPVATATVRGTEFAIEDNGDLTVLEGDVWYEAGGEGILVFGGEKAGVGPDGKPYKESDQDLANGKKNQWWLAFLDFADEFVMPTSQQLVAMTTATLVLAGNGLDSGNSLPEPASMVALGAGMAIVVSRKRKREDSVRS